LSGCSASTGDADECDQSHPHVKNELTLSNF